MSDPEKKLEGVTGRTTNTADSEDYDCGIVYLTPLEKFRLELVEKAHNIELRLELAKTVDGIPARTQEEVRKLRSQAGSHAGKHTRKPRSPFRARVLPSMAECKRDGGELKRFIQAWEQNPIGGLKLKTAGDGFVIEDENATENEPGSWPCTFSALAGWWSVCDIERPPVTSQRS